MPQRKLYGLKLRRKTWYIRFYLTPEEQAIYGKPEVVETLKTRDEREALRRAVGHAASILQRLKAAPLALQARDPSSITAVADKLRGHHDADAADAFLDAALDAHLDTYPPSQRDPDTGMPLQPHEDLAVVVADARSRVRDPDYKPLCEWVAAYLHAKATGPRPLVGPTIQAKRRVLDMFARWAGTRLDPRHINRRRAVQYVDEVIKHRTCSAKTMVDEAANLTAFFNWLQDSGVIDVNPFHRVSGRIASSTRGREKPRRAWSDAELRALLSAQMPRPSMSAVVLLALFTGARLEELCQLRATKDVDAEAFHIREGKTQSSVRVVPIHPIIAPLVAKLVATTRDGFLIADQSDKNQKGKRSFTVSKDFSNWRTRNGIGDGSKTPLHALRHTVVTRLQSLGVAESSAKLVVGHHLQTMTFGTYGGDDWRIIRDALLQLTYGSEVDQMARDAVAAHEGNPPAGKYRPRALQAPVRS